ncbi:hypothetical protein HDU78_006568 [Chytriomyces hyalinus]|nr:hypothetical protein HDU78_006568 [Chytriomyces hyalinus]
MTAPNDGRAPQSDATDSALDGHAEKPGVSDKSDAGAGWAGSEGRSGEDSGQNKTTDSKASAPASVTEKHLTRSKQKKKNALLSLAHRVFPDTPPDLPPIFPIPRTQSLAKQTHEIVIPSHSTWFSFDTIHSIERKSLPEFFNGLHPSKTPSIYKNHRNFMVNSFRINPGEYLTITACRRNLVGDVAGVIKIHAFLEQWGLINYQVEPDTRPSQVGPTFRGHFRITAHTPIQPFVPVPTGVIPAQKSGQKKTPIPAPSELISTSSSKDQPQQVPELSKSAQLSAPSASDVAQASIIISKPSKQQALSNLRTRLLDFQNQRSQRYRRAPPVTCSSCGVPCGRNLPTPPKEKENAEVNTAAETIQPPTTALSTDTQANDKSNNETQPVAIASSARWHCLKNTSMDLCSGCFDDGRFPATFLSSDFIKLGHGASPEEIALSRLDAIIKGGDVASSSNGSTNSIAAIEAEAEELDPAAVDLGDLYDDEEGRLPWTHEEIFLLLEGVEHFDEDWGRIAFHIGTRSKEECVEKFLAYSIEERFLVEGGAGGVLGYRRAGEILKNAPLKSNGCARLNEKGAVGEASGTNSNAFKSSWPISVLDALPCTPAEDAGMALSALLASVVDSATGKLVANAAVHAVHEAEAAAAKAAAAAASLPRSASPTRKTPVSPLKSPRMSFAGLSGIPSEFGHSVHEAELSLKKFGLILTRYERKSSHLEHQRCQVENERRSVVLDAIVHQKEVREVRKRQKLEVAADGDAEGEIQKVDDTSMEVERNEELSDGEESDAEEGDEGEADEGEDGVEGGDDDEQDEQIGGTLPEDVMMAEMINEETLEAVLGEVSANGMSVDEGEEDDIIDV